METPYPITITREQITEAGACSEGIAAFDQVAPTGTLTIPDAAAHVALLSSPIAPFEGWAIDIDAVPPIAASAGYRGTATAGDYGTATAGDDGTATAGDGGIITISWFDGHRRRLLTGYVGEGGIKADTPYRASVTGGSARFVEVK